MARESETLCAAYSLYLATLVSLILIFAVAWVLADPTKQDLCFAY